MIQSEYQNGALQKQGGTMHGKIIVEITEGVQTGQKYEYTEANRVFIGRQDDCGIVLPEKTVSRYHCILTINPPTVRLQDFGSLNGTYINGNKIGQRDRDKSWEEARNEVYQEFDLHDGDLIRLGKRCELKCSIEQQIISDVTISDENLGPSEADRIQAEQAEREKAEREKAEREKAEREKAEREKAEREKAEKERAAKEKAEREKAEREKAAKEKAAREKAAKEKAAKEKAERERAAREKAEKEKAEREKAAREKAAREKAEREKAEREKAERERAEKERQRMQARSNAKKICKGCGKSFVPKGEDNNLCPECIADRAKILDGILAAILGDAIDNKGQVMGASPVDGYDKVALLGKGGMGEVWKVRERKTGKLLALKTMLPQVAADERGKKMFLREAALCEQLNHRNVVKTYQTGCANGVFYILMDLCEGGSAQDLMEKNRGRLSLNMATYIILQALTGLDYVHNLDVSVEIRKRGFWSAGTKNVEAHGLVHRDFKPGNIFLSDRSDHPVAKVADFGMAKAFETAGMTDMTSSGQASGTVAFMPRQQALDYRFSKPEVDVWAAAASYYYMLTGMPPKNLKPQPLLWQSLVQESAVPIRQRNSSIPTGIASVIDRALVERPEIGYKSAAALRRDIIAALPYETRAYCKGIL